ncbi:MULTISPECIES: enoyl-CoA hydratase-related protein [Actinomycetes]|uniref:enoyl-CoA hydratase/isomerase family protein n=1 Tax=Actinomycetes TaxID=1760 RepID=UPI0004C0DDFA|nr:MULTISPECIES: enoyl-CoA hydratase-related protein [Actinomycetes]
MDPELVVSDRGHVRTFRLDRPQSLNALSFGLQRELAERLVEADATEMVRVIVLTGSGNRAFCPGIDLKEVGLPSAGSWKGPYAQPHKSLWEVVSEVSKPTIAALNGLAVGGGFELALACDLIVAVKGAIVGLPEAKIGLAASFGSAVLARRMPYAAACEILFTGKLRPIDELVQWGLVTKVVNADQLASEVEALADMIASNAPLSVRRMKATMTKGATLPLMAAVRLDSGPDPYTSSDRTEGVQAFLEKRAPNWVGH